MQTIANNAITLERCSYSLSPQISSLDSLKVADGCIIVVNVISGLLATHIQEGATTVASRVGQEDSAN